jgi:hypothetical protein
MRDDAEIAAGRGRVVALREHHDESQHRGGGERRHHEQDRRTRSPAQRLCLRRLGDLRPLLTNCALVAR